MEIRELDLFERVAHIVTTMPDELFTDPEDDWIPVLMLEAGNGDIVSVPIHDYMETEKTKDLLAEVLMPSVIADVKATKAVMVISAWTSRKAAESMERGGEYVPPSQQLDREEAVFLIEYTREGVTRQAHAKIMRSETQVPQLGEWEELPADSFSGRFVEPIVKALKAVRV